MEKIALAYGDRHLYQVLDGIIINGQAIKLMSTPQARNSQMYDGRLPCLGSSSCVPICPFGAKYDAGIHVDKAIKGGAKLLERTLVTKLEADRLTVKISAYITRPGMDNQAL